MNAIRHRVLDVKRNSAANDNGMPLGARTTERSESIMTNERGAAEHADVPTSKYKRHDSLVLILLGALFAGGPLASTTIGPLNGYYILGSLLILAALIRAGFQPHAGTKMTGLAKFSVIVFPLLWVYGVIVGLANNNVTTFVFRNFAGMLLYPIAFFIFQSRPDPQRILNFLRYLGILIALVSIVLYRTSSGLTYSAAILVGGVDSQIDVGGMHPRILFFGQYILFVLYALAIDRVSRRGTGFGGRVIALVEIVIVIYVAIICADSKGYLLALLLIAAAMMLVPSSDASRSLRKRTASTAIRLFALVPLIPFAVSFVHDTVFSTSLSGNAVRSQQIYMLLDNVTFLGRGLGAVIPGYVRAESFEYGFELSYLSVLHKFGALSLVAFGVLAAAVILGVRGWARGGPNRALFAGALGCMGYLAPAIGNPVLFAPQAVVLNCLALYLLDAGHNRMVDRHEGRAAGWTFPDVKPTQSLIKPDQRAIPIRTKPAHRT